MYYLYTDKDGGFHAQCGRCNREVPEKERKLITDEAADYFQVLLVMES